MQRAYFTSLLAHKKVRLSSRNEQQQRNTLSFSDLLCSINKKNCSLNKRLCSAYSSPEDWYDGDRLFFTTYDDEYDMLIRRQRYIII